MRTTKIILFFATLLYWGTANAQETTAQDSLQPIRDSLRNFNDTIQMPTDTVAKENEFNQPIFYESNDSIYFSVNKKKAYMYKSAKIKSGQVELDADFIHIDMATNIIYASGLADSSGTVTGKPIFKDGKDSFESDSIKYHIKTKRGIVKNVISEQSGGYLHGGVTKMHTNKHIHVSDGKYTTCDLDHPHFYIKLSKAKVIPDEKIISGPLNFVILDIPTPIGLPFGYFPSSANRKSGVLMPKYGEDQQRGFFLRDGGYYWAISPYVDAAVVGSYFSRGSWDATLRSKYKLRYRFNGEMNIKYGKNVIGEEGLPGFVDKRSYSVQLRHAQDPKSNPYSRFNMSVKYEGGSHRALNSTNYQDYVNTVNTSSISYNLTPTQNWNLMVSANATQNTKTNQVNATAPNFSLNVNRRYFFGNDKKGGKKKWYEKIEYRYTAQGKANIEGIDSTILTNKTKVDAGFSHEIPISASYKFLKYFTLSPNVRYKGVLYPNYIEKKWFEKTKINGVVKQDTIITDTIPEMKYGHSVSPNISLGFAPQIYGFYTFSKKAKVSAIRHLLSPSISLSLSPDGKKMNPGYYNTYTYVDSDGNLQEEEYSIFEKGVYGTPSLGSEAGSVSFSLKNQLEMKVRKSGVDSTAKESERFQKISLLDNFNTSMAYNIYAEQFKWSDLRLNGNTSLFDRKITLNFGGSFTIYDHNIETGQAIDEFRIDNGKSLLRFKQGNLALGANINPDFFKKKTEEDKDNKDKEDKKNKQNKKYLGVPWNLNINYSFNYSSRWNSVTSIFEPQYTQTLNLNGDLKITDKWSFNFRTGWDFQAEKIAPTTFNITRDLHCWEMRMNWIPFGRLQSYYFQINVKSSVFEGLKYQMRETVQLTEF